jgi:hypothetical protein
MDDIAKDISAARKALAQIPMSPENDLIAAMVLSAAIARATDRIVSALDDINLTIDR